MTMNGVMQRLTSPVRGIRIPGLVLLALLVVLAPGLHAQNIGGHIGFVLPLVTHAGGNTTNLGDNFSIGFPMGITFRGQGKTAFDLEFVPGVQDKPRQTTLTVHPGLIYGLTSHVAVGMRLAFDVNSSQFGFTPLLNYSWKVENSFIKAYFVEADLPVRFNRPTGGPATNPVTFAAHFGVGF